MEKPKQEDIPRSIIKGSGVIHADLDSPKGRGELLFVNPKCVVVGLHNLPHTLFITPEFDENILPLKVEKDIYKVKELILQPSFFTETYKSIKYCKIPVWLANFKHMESLWLKYVELDDLNYLKDLPLQYLIIEDIKYSDSKKLIAAIKQLKHLKEISYDQSLSADLIHAIKELNLILTPVTGDF